MCAGSPERGPSGATREVERCTASARHVIEGPQGQVGQVHTPYIGTEHMLLALLERGPENAHVVLHEAGVNADRVREGSTG